MLFRVRTKEGQFTVSLSQPSPTLLDLKYAIRAQLGVPVGEQTIKRNPSDRKILRGDSTRLDHFGFSGETAAIFLQTNKTLSPPKEKEKQESSDPEEEILRDVRMKWTMDEYIHFRSKGEIRIEQQTKAVCERVLMEINCAKSFQQFLVNTKYRMQRMGILYGRVDDELNEIIVESLYEPPQDCMVDGVAPLHNDFEVSVDALALMLGWRRVGWVFSHRRRDLPLTAIELIYAAEMQKKYGSHVCTIVVIEESDGKMKFEAYQASKQFVQLRDEKIVDWSEGDDPSKVSVVGKKRIIVDNKEQTFIHVHRLLTPVAITEREGEFSVQFPVENRPDLMVDKETVKRFLKQNVNKDLASLFKDFHFLLYLISDHCQFEVTSDGPALCSAAISGDSITLQQFLELLDGYLSVE